MSNRVADELARRDIGAFMRRVWPWWQTARHHRLLEDYANRLAFGKNLFVALSLPPRHSKSQIFSVAFPAFFLGHFPDKSVMHISHTLSLSTEFSFEIRQMARDDMTYRRLFPAMRLHPEKRRLDNWKTTRGGSFRSFGAGGGISGLGADRIIIDDLMKEGDERSVATMLEKWHWYTSAARTRLAPGGCIVVPMTRWSEEDIIGRLQKEPGGDEWVFVRLPGLAEKDDILGRDVGEALWPERFDAAYLRGMRKLNPAYFDALYQQDPRAAVAHPFKRDYFKLVESVFRRDREKKPFWAVDLAITESAAADFTAMGRCFQAGDNLFVSRPFRCQEEWPDVKKRLRGILVRFPEDRMIFEHRNMELMAVQEFQREFPGRVLAVKTPGDKMARASAAAAVGESGRLLMVNWIEDGVDYREIMIDELVRFPSQHDDFVDMLSLACHFSGLAGVSLLAQPENGDDGGRERRKLREREALGRIS